MTDGSSYRVFELPKESPNDGPRTLVENPADATASPFGWHDTNAATGPEFTIARGTNVHAYLDQDDSDAADFGEPDGGPGLDFDFPLDLTQHAQNYRAAAVSNLFYWNNVFHDVTYRYGFNEAAGNFQANNYGNGGTQGDYVRAEAADGGGTENANFATPIETPTSGGTPRMQMYLWPGDEFGAQNQVVVDGLGSFDSSWARFSPAPTPAGTSGRLINAGNGCAAADYAGAPAGDWIAIVTGSNLGCQNVQKARQASTAGAKALIVALNSGGAAPILTGSLTTAAPTIPVASITQADGNAIRAAIAAGPTTGTRSQASESPGHPRRRPGERDHHPRVRPRRLEPPDGRSCVSTACPATSRRARGGATTSRSRCCSTRRSTIPTSRVAWARTRSSRPTGTGPAFGRGPTRATWRSSRSPTTASRPVAG